MPRRPGQRRLGFIFLFSAALLLMGCQGSDRAAAPHRPASSTTSAQPDAPTATPTQTPASPRGSAARCPWGPDPLAGVNSPDRLTVKADCVTVHGIVGCIRRNPGDGDTTMEVLLDKGQSRYLTPANEVWHCRSDQGSDLAPRIHVEVTPQHCEVKQTNCADLVPFKNPKIPKNGQHVSVTGAWVLDTSHNRGFHDWAEIHPAARIVVRK